jgi:hypothetical protein
MGLDIRLPNITATDTEGKMSQMQSYMHQLVEQLNWALSTVDNAIQGNTSNVVMTSQKAQNSEESAVDTFNSIKALIIKSADIVTAYEETMREDFNGEYVAVSDFGTYTQKTDLAIETNSKGVSELYTNVQTIGDDVKETNAYIKRGELEDGIYGIEVGQTDANNVFSHYARFTAKRLSFYDEYGNEVAYIGSTEKSGSKLYINTAHFLGSVQFGDYKADSSDGLAFLWIGG